MDRNSSLILKTRLAESWLSWTTVFVLVHTSCDAEAGIGADEHSMAKLVDLRRMSPETAPVGLMVLWFTSELSVRSPKPPGLVGKPSSIDL